MSQNSVFESMAHIGTAVSFSGERRACSCGSEYGHLRFFHHVANQGSLGRVVSRKKIGPALSREVISDSVEEKLGSDIK